MRRNFQHQLLGLIHNFLDGVLYELVKRVELLPHEALVVKERGDDNPTVLLRDGVVACGQGVRLAVALGQDSSPEEKPPSIAVCRLVETSLQLEEETLGFPFFSHFHWTFALDITTGRLDNEGTDMTGVEISPLLQALVLDAISRSSGDHLLQGSLLGHSSSDAETVTLSSAHGTLDPELCSSLVFLHSKTNPSTALQGFFTTTSSQDKAQDKAKDELSMEISKALAQLSPCLDLPSRLILLTLDLPTLSWSAKEILPLSVTASVPASTKKTDPNGDDAFQVPEDSEEDSTQEILGGLLLSPIPIKKTLSQLERAACQTLSQGLQTCLAPASDTHGTQAMIDKTNALLDQASAYVSTMLQNPKAMETSSAQGRFLSSVLDSMPLLDPSVTDSLLDSLLRNAETAKALIGLTREQLSLSEHVML